jgi:transposase-like protein
MYASGMTTRDIQAHVEELYGFEASEMLVSRLVERLDPELAAWRSRGLEAIYGIVFVDAIHLKVRHASGVKSTAAYQVCGYGEGGTLELLGVYMAPEGYSPAESASFWHQVLVELEHRGVQEMLIVCADALTGLDKAIEAVYPRASLQPCVVHLMRGSLVLVHHSERKPVARELKRIYQAPTYEAAERALEEVEALWGKRYPHLVAKWTEALPHLAKLYQYSMPLRTLVYTTNPIENINRQIRKVTKNRGVMPNVDSALRLLTLVVRKIDEAGQGRRRPDWSRISKELAIHFPGRLPQTWGLRFIV